MRNRLIDHVPMYELSELNGKTLTISVGEDYNVETGLRYTSVMGIDESGNTYVIVNRQEPLDVHPK